MQRSHSIDIIKNNPPSKIIRICLEKTYQLLQPAADRKELDEGAMKRIKYWMKIAETLSKDIEKEEEFNEFVQNLKTSYSMNDQLIELLSSDFPQTTEQQITA
jgi:hypothetical protein